MKAIRTIAVLVVVAAAFFGGYAYRAVRTGSGAAEKGGRKILYWVDPMHPAYKSDKPGIAPDCGMKLEPVYADGGGPSAAPAGGQRKALYYRDPKDPKYTAPQPGLNPETGNELEPVYANDLSAMPVGTVEITPEKQQLIGVKYGEVSRNGGSRTIRAVAKVAFDETRIQHIHTRVDGWIDQVFVDYTGQLVGKGQPLMTVYSPEMLASQRELLLARKAADTMKGNPLPAAFDQSESLLQAARRRLELWDLSQSQIDQVLKTGQPIKNVTLYSPIAGYVTDRKAFPQLRVTPDIDLYTIVDLSRVWIMADLFEYEAPNIHAGETARVTLQAVPGRVFTARINYIQPQVDPMTRTLKVRLDMDNPGLILKPDMYANVEFHVNIPAQLTVPVDAVLDAGERKTVFVDRGNGFFEPRQVTTGERDGNRIQILSGLSGGERIVTSGNFLIDSESQLKAAAAGMGGMAGMPGMTNEPMKTPKGQPEPPSGKGSPNMPDMPGMGTRKP
ncbi:MAG: efflux RND transporter periplasmic adaptor subunit [Acidobacteriia bacterium]|nr:efflux RND transporter periplasmic adaptor subunit [Terriglobia bacterium]